MKKRIIILVCLFNVLFPVVPVMGQAYYIETDVAAQKETTDNKLSSGISSLIFDENLIANNVNIEYTSYEVPSNTGFKSFMSYKSITDKTSKQYTIQKDYAYTGKYGIRQVDNRYCIAVGTAFNLDVGTYFDLVLKNETIIECILGDVKADEHTLSDNITTASNGCVSEFIADLEFLDSNIKYHGDVSMADATWNSPVVEIRVYDKNILE